MGPSKEDLVQEKLGEAKTMQALVWGTWELDTLRDWNAESIQASLRHIAELCELKFRDLVRIYFVAITGRTSATPLFDSMAVLGADICRARLRQALEAMGGLGKKAEKKQRKALAAAIQNLEEKAETSDP
jgi:glutamyl-tRNA synthetase